MRIGFVGGGTGGHFYPLMAVADVLNTGDLQPELLYFGPAPYNQEQLAQHQIRFVYCPAGKVRMYFSIQNFFDVFRNFFGIFVAVWKLYVLYPDVIFSKGGYTSVPILIAARFLRIPVVIHESDAIPGRANKIAIKFAEYIGIAYDDAAQYFPPEKTALVGIPILMERHQIPADPFAALGIPNDKPLIYVTGGSTGADRLNNLMIRTLTALLPDYRIFHQTGPANVESLTLAAQKLLENSPLQHNYYIQGSIPPEMVTALMSAASLIITRAGSTTLFEIAYHKKPSIIIPIPEDVSRDQRTNAYAYARSGGAVVIEEHNLTEHLLVHEIQSIINAPEKLASMSAAAGQFFIPGASKKIASALLSIGIKHGS